MSHEVDESTGKALLVYNRVEGVPWHELGTPINGLFTVDEAKVTNPELFFTVEGRPLYAPTSSIDGVFDIAAGTIAVDGHKAIVRTDTEKVLGVTSTTYREYQPESVFRFGEAIVGEGGLGSVAGSLYDGRLVFITFTVGDEGPKRLFDFDPSDYLRYVVASAGNDGRHALRVKNTDVRVLCANTYNAHKSGAGRELVIRHTSKMEARVEDAKRALGFAAAAQEQFVAEMTDLSKRDVNWADVEAYLETLFPIANPDDGKSHARVESAREKVGDLFLHSPNLDGVDKTAYRLFNATTDYLDHVRNYSSGLGSNADARAMAVLDGAAQDTKDRALKLLLSAK